MLSPHSRRCRSKLDNNRGPEGRLAKDRLCRLAATVDPNPLSNVQLNRNCQVLYEDVLGPLHSHVLSRFDKPRAQNNEDYCQTLLALEPHLGQSLAVLFGRFLASEQCTAIGGAGSTMSTPALTIQV